MANPSDTNPSAVGKEVLRRNYVDGIAENEVILCTGLANHIMTIISIVICSVSGPADATIEMMIDYDLGGNDLYLLRELEVGVNDTFVFNDKIILTDTDRLLFKAWSVSGTAAFDAWCTYIDQEFTT